MSWLDKILGKGANAAASDLPQFTPVSSVKVEHPNGYDLFQDQVDRKAWTEGLLHGEGVPINPYLPFTEPESDTRIRPLDEVIKRFQCLAVVAARASGLEDETLRNMIFAMSLDGHFTPDETAFLNDPAPDQKTSVNMSWRNEAAWALAWALGFFPRLERPEQLCDMSVLSKAVMDEHPEKNGLRSTNDILNMLDLTYRYHWAIRQAQLDGAPIPAGLSASVVVERHHALNWLTYYLDAEWDYVTTDT